MEELTSFHRTSEVQHGPGGGVTRDYTSPEDGQGPAHAVTQVDESGSGGSTAHFYDYDEAGNMVSRKSGEHDQTLEWGPEGELTKVTGDLSETEYVYDADGERLLRRANGVTTLYLPGMEVTWDPAEGTEEATRYFTHAGETVAVRENSGRLHWIVSDHHDTGQISIDAHSNEVAQRRMTVFGQDRGTTGSWPGERGFVDGMIDASTGLTQLGARAYEADLGRFISVDPLMDLVDAQTMNGYAYANNSPATYWDGSGLSYCTPADGICMEAGGNTTVSYTNKGRTESGVQTWNYKKGSGWRQISYTQYRTTWGGRTQSRRSNMGSTWSQWRTVVKKSVPNRPPLVNATVSSEERSLWESAWDGVQNSASTAWGWTKDNWGTISKVAGWVGFGACVVVSAGACLAIGGGILAVNIGMDHAVNGSINWKEHGWSALMLGFGGGAAAGVGRLASGTWRGAAASMRSRPTVRAGSQKWDRNPRSGNPQRREGIFQGWDMKSGPVDWGASSAGYAINIASGSTFGGPVPYSNPFARN